MLIVTEPPSLFQYRELRKLHTKNNLLSGADAKPPGFIPNDENPSTPTGFLQARQSNIYIKVNRIRFQEQQQQ